MDFVQSKPHPLFLDKIKMDEIPKLNEKKYTPSLLWAISEKIKMGLRIWNFQGVSKK